MFNFPNYVLLIPLLFYFGWKENNLLYDILGTLLLLYYGWKRDKDEERAEKANRIIKRDKKLYDYMKKGLKEYQWIKKDIYFEEVYYPGAKDKELIFENIDVKIYKVKHFAETRLGFFIKDTQEYGLYASFEGYPRYYRSDESFTKEEYLMYDEDDD